MPLSTSHDIFRRWEGNPILTMDDMPFRCNTVFNGTPAKIDGEYRLLIRVEGQQGASLFALARSKDGLEFKVDPRPVLLPAKHGLFGKYEERGIEDPRATYILFDDGGIVYRRLEYPVKKTVLKIRSIPELHPSLAERLLAGR